jgi:hypothetical protein
MNTRTNQTNIYAIIPEELWNGISENPAKDLAVIVNEKIIQDIIPVHMVPNDINTIKLPGCTLLPGLIDAHVHYSSVMGPAFLLAGVTTIRDVGNDLHWILKERSFNESNNDSGPSIVCCGHLQDGPVKYWPNMGRANINADSIRYR